jgi:RHS repeat-associated protein
VTLPTGESSAVKYSFDGFGRAKDREVALPDGRSLRESFTRDSLGEIAEVEVTADGGSASSAGRGRWSATADARSPQPVVLAQIGLGTDRAGRRNRVRVDSLVREFKFDARGRVDGDRVLGLDSAQRGGASVIAGRQYRWRADSVIDAVDDVLAGHSELSVDSLGRVTAVSRSESSSADPWATGESSGAQAVTEFYGFTAAGVLDRVDPGADFREGGAGESSLGAGEAAATGKPRSEGRGSSSSMKQGECSGADALVGVDLDGTLVRRVGRTHLHYDGCGRVVRTETRRVSRKRLVRHFTYGATGQVREFTSSDHPGVKWVYSYDGLARRVAKDCVDLASGRVVARDVFVHDGNRLVGEQRVIGADHLEGSGHVGNVAEGHVGAPRVGLARGRVWMTDPGTGEFLGQIELDGQYSRSGSADPVRARFYALVADLEGAPRELIDPDTSEVVGRARQSLYGQRTWRGVVSSPLLFAGQYEDAESGWVYNRFRYYDPASGVYGSQDPLGVGPKVATSQGYVDHCINLVDVFGLMSHRAGTWQPKEVAGKKVYQNNDGTIFDPHQEYNVRGGGTETNIDRMSRGLAPRGVDGKPVNLHHIGQRDDSALVEITKTRHTENSRQLHIFSGIHKENFPSDVTPVDRDKFNEWRPGYWEERAKDFQ